MIRPPDIDGMGWVLAASILLGLVGLPIESRAQTSGFDGGADRSPTVDDLSPALSDGEAYSERYSVSFTSERGVEVYLNWSISNLGWGDHHGSAKVTVKFRERPDYTFQKTVDRKAWSTDEEGFGLDIADTSIAARQEGGFQIHHAGEVSLELTLRGGCPRWSPGGGRIEVDGGYLERRVFGLRASAAGRIKVDGEWREIAADEAVYGDHVRTDIAPYGLADRFSRARIVDGDRDLMVVWRETKLTEAHGGESVTWLVVAYRDEIVLADPDAAITFGRIRRDGEAGYRIPHAVQIEGEQGGDTVKLVMRATRRTGTDLLAGYGRVAKLLASSVSKPYSYYFDSDYQIEMAIGGRKASVRGEGGYTMDILNQ
jgi:hypothetical protein